MCIDDMMRVAGNGRLEDVGKTPLPAATELTRVLIYNKDRETSRTIRVEYLLVDAYVCTKTSTQQVKQV
jgi:hypothetical protein